MNLPVHRDVPMSADVHQQPVPAELCSDEELLTRLRAGQLELFGILVRRYERELYGYLRRYLGDDALAEDVFQNTFLQLFTNLDKYDQGKPVRPWLYTIATNQAIDAMRRLGRRATVSLDQASAADGNGDWNSLLPAISSKVHDPFEHLAEEERREKVRSSVDRLPEHLRAAVILAYYQGLKYREIAEVLGIPVGTVKSRLHVALQRLQESWQADALPRE